MLTRTTMQQHLTVTHHSEKTRSATESRKFRTQHLPFAQRHSEKTWRGTERLAQNLFIHTLMPFIASFLNKTKWLVLAVLMSGFSLLGFGQDEILLYENDFENYAVEPMRGCYIDLDQRNVNELYFETGIGTSGTVEFDQTFTVETILVNGTGNLYSDPQNIAGNYCIGFLATAQDDLLSLSFNSFGLDSINISFDISAISITSDMGCGVGATARNPKMRISIYDTPNNDFNINSLNSFTLLDEMELAGTNGGTTKFEFNWIRVNADLNIGNSTNNNITILFNLLENYYGAFDNLRITANETCDTSEINLENGLAAHYPFESNAIDESPNANNGEILGATLTTDRFGNENNAFHFDGNSHIRIEDDPSLRPQDFTISLWCRFDDLSSSRLQLIIDKHLGTAYLDSYEIWFENNAVKAILSGENDFGSELSKDLMPNTDKWYHIVYSFSDENDVANLYIDTILVDSKNEATTIAYDTEPLLIGASNDTQTPQAFFNGDIDDVRIYNRVLSSCEIEALFEMPYVSYIEDCSDGKDNDGDGYIDCEDLDCQNNLLYSNDFDNEIGNEWSLIKTEPINNTTVLGVFNRSEDYTFSLDNLQIGDSITICFDLWILGTWDGNSGNDRITISSSGSQVLLDATFANVNGSQSFPDNIGEGNNPAGTEAVLSGNYY